MRRPRVLVACEYSGRVRDAFAARGWEAWSCDLLPTDAPGLHHTGDVTPLLTQQWDLLVAHPPCTYLTIAAEWAYGDGPYHQKVKPETLVGAARRAARVDALAFVRLLLDAPLRRIALENPIGCISTRIRPSSQTIQPWMFGHDASKATCLWLKGLPPLAPTKRIEPRVVDGKPRWGNQTDSGQNRLSPSVDRWKVRSETYLGIAQAMADQWGPVIERELEAGHE